MKVCIALCTALSLLFAGTLATAADDVSTKEYADTILKHLNEQQIRETPVTCHGDERLRTIGNYLDEHRAHKGTIGCLQENQQTKCYLGFTVKEEVPWWKPWIRPEVMQVLLHTLIEKDQFKKVITCFTVP